MQNRIYKLENKNAYSLISNIRNSRLIKYKMSNPLIVFQHSQQRNIFNIPYFSHIEVKFMKICEESHYLTKVNKNTEQKYLKQTGKAFAQPLVNSPGLYFIIQNATTSRGKSGLNCIKIFENIETISKFHKLK